MTALAQTTSMQGGGSCYGSKDTQLTFDPLMTFGPCSFVGPPDKDHAYIVCPAPLEGTVEDFWRMVWEQGTRTIVMVTGEMEQGKKACERSAVGGSKL